MRSSRRSSPSERALVVLAAGLLSALVLGCGTPAQKLGNQPVPPAPTIEDAWVGLPMGATDMTAAYMTIQGATIDTKLLRVTSPDAASVTLHLTTTDASGMTGMRPVPEIPIPANSTVRLEPGGYHLMLEGLKAPLAAGQHIVLDVAFDTGVTETIQAEVRAG
jgi:hypothetical protein